MKNISDTFDTVMLVTKTLTDLLMAENKILQDSNLKLRSCRADIKILLYLVNTSYSNYLSLYWHLKQ